MTPADIAFLVADGGLVLNIPTYDALIFGSDTDPSYALRSDYNHLLTKSFRDAKRFWDIQSDDIQLHAMHGDMLLDTERVARLLVLFGETEAQAAAHAATIAQVVATSPAFDDGNNPIFTLNAFAFSGEGDPDPFFASLPDKLIFGDGVLDALDWIGIGNVGARAVLGHEFGHHIQFELNLFDSPLTGGGGDPTDRADGRRVSPRTGRRTLAGSRSTPSASWTRCSRSTPSVTAPSTTPTTTARPTSAGRAAEWGANLAATARPQGKILPSLTVAQLFEAKLPEFVAPDALARTGSAASGDAVQRPSDQLGERPPAVGTRCVDVGRRLLDVRG